MTHFCPNCKQYFITEEPNSIHVTIDNFDKVINLEKKTELLSFFKKLVKENGIKNRCKHDWCIDHSRIGEEYERIFCLKCYKGYTNKDLSNILNNLDDEATCQGN